MDVGFSGMWLMDPFDGSYCQHFHGYVLCDDRFAFTWRASSVGSGKVEVFSGREVKVAKLGIVTNSSGGGETTH